MNRCFPERILIYEFKVENQEVVHFIFVQSRSWQWLWLFISFQKKLKLFSIIGSFSSGRPLLLGASVVAALKESKSALKSTR